jgi:hypothetical protein
MEWRKVASTSVFRVGYSAATRVLGVEFVRGGRYEYLGVSDEEYAALMGAESIGLHVNRHIKGRFEHRCCSGWAP